MSDEDDEKQEILDNLADLARVLKALGKNADSLTCTRAAIWIAGTTPAPEARAIRWMVAIQTDRGYLIDGHPYVSRESAQQDVNLITARGEKAEVWECYRSQPQSHEAKK